MLFLYNLVIQFTGFLLKILALCNPKIKLFVADRKHVFEIVENKMNSSQKSIWFHAASLGEYEQGLPVLEKIKEKYPNHTIVLTFFSPSGYEVRKTNQVADITVYLPLDSKKNATRFINSIKPEMVFFIKYEFWPNYLNELKERKIPVYLISGIFRENQFFFKWYGGFYKKALDTFAFFFVQNESSKKLLLQLNKTNVVVSGDTRFDRVATILEKDNFLDFIEEFKNETLTIVVGSSWPKDEDLLVNYINKTNEKVKFIIAPHNIHNDQILALKKSISKPTILFSEKANQNLADFNVLIIDTIGILTKIYSHADIAYVGGGFGHPGVHNLLEPATFGIPVVIGPNYSHFPEAIALHHLGGCISVANFNELKDTLSNLISNKAIRNEKGHICSTFVQMNTGATAKIINQIPTNLT